MELAHELEHWREFYLLLGTAGATLVALLFVAVSVGTGYVTEDRAEATRTFFSPVVIHFAAVFFLSCIAVVPGHNAMFLPAVGYCTPARSSCCYAWDLMLSMVRRHVDTP